MLASAGLSNCARKKKTLKGGRFGCAGALTPYRLVNSYRRFERAWCLHLQGQGGGVLVSGGS